MIQNDHTLSSFLPEGGAFRKEAYEAMVSRLESSDIYSLHAGRFLATREDSKVLWMGILKESVTRTLLNRVN